MYILTVRAMTALTIIFQMCGDEFLFSFVVYTIPLCVYML